MSQKGIGRQVQLGVSKETSRGTAPASVSYYLAWADGTPEEKYDNVIDIETRGVIEDSANVNRVKNWMEAALKIPVLDKSFPLFLYSLLGTDTPASHGAAYDHVFTIAQSVQHQSLALYIHDPLAAVDYSHANCIVKKLDLELALKKYIDATITIVGQKGVSISTLTPSQAEENRFLPQHVTFKVAATQATLAAASAYAVKSLKLTIDQNVDDDDVLGLTYPRDFLNKEVKIEGTLEAIFSSEADFKTAALANTLKALRIDATNTDVDLGGGVHPEIQIDLNQVFFTEYSLPRKLKDLVYQTVKFKATYKPADGKMITITATNAVATY